MLKKIGLLLASMMLISCASVPNDLAQPKQSDICVFAQEQTFATESEIKTKTDPSVKSEVLACTTDLADLGHFYSRFETNSTVVELLFLAIQRGNQWKVSDVRIIIVYNKNTGEGYVNVPSSRGNLGSPNNQKGYDI